MTQNIKNLYTFQELINMPENEDDWLVEDLVPRGSNVGLVGRSETCKSTLLRQLALSINLGFDDFLGYKLDVKSGNVLYINTEESARSVRRKLDLQLRSLLGTEYNVDSLPGETYVYFENNDIIEFIQAKLEEIEVDLIIIDGFADIFPGDINTSNSVKSFLADYSKVANTYDLSVIFMHHFGKGSNTIARDRILGSTAFEQSLRSVLAMERKSDHFNLHVLKNNDISYDRKQKIDVLELGDDLILKKVDFAYKGGARAPLHTSKHEELIEKYPQVIDAIIYKEYTYTQAEEYLKAENFKVSRGTLCKAVKYLSQE